MIRPRCIFDRFVRAAARRQSRRMPPRTAHRAEYLEDRSLLTGNVQAVVSGGSLLLTGDAQANEVQVGITSGDITVTGVNGTTINGATTAFVAVSGSIAIRGNFEVRLLGGDDVLTVNAGLTVVRDFLFEGGSGNDGLSLTDLLVLDNINVRTAAGNDQVAFNNVPTGDTMRINTGSGDDSVTINVAGIDDNLHIHGGSGNDTISYEGGVVDDFVTIHGDDGDDSIALFAVSVGDNLDLDGGEGADTILLNTVSVDDNLEVRGGSGDDRISTTTVFIKDFMTVHGQNGNDSVLIDSTTVIDNLRFTGGSGDDIFQLTGSSIGDNLLADTGDGDDIVSLDASDVDDLASITTGDGADSVLFSSSRLLDAALVDTGSGADFIRSSGSSFSGFAQFTTGSGDDNVVATGATRFGSAFIVADGGGTDTVDLAAGTVLRRGLTASGIESRSIDATVLDGLLNDPVTGAVTRIQAAEDSITGGLAPVAADDSFTLANGTITVDAAGGVLANDSRSSLNSPLSATIVTNTANGALTLNADGSFTYTAGNTFTGTDTFTYRISDGFGGTDTATVTLAGLGLTLDLTANTTEQSSGTLVTQDAAFQIDGTTSSGATVSIDADGDGQFDDGTTTAGTDGSFSLTTTLTHTDTNLGANVIVVRADNGTEQLDETVNVHLAEGTVVRFDTTLGAYDVELFDLDAPQTVAAFLADLNRYDDSIVHRSDDQFVIQGGGFTVLDGQVGDVTPFTAPPNEFIAQNSNLRGTLSTAQVGGNINSFTGQWFINTVDNTGLDNVPHTVFGRVIGDGMTVVDQINNLAVFNLTAETGEGALTEVPLRNFTQSTTPISGTVSVTANSATVTGTGTAFLTDLAANDFIRIAGLVRQVVSIESDTSLTLSAAHTDGAVGATLRIVPGPDNYIFSPISRLL